MFWVERVFEKRLEYRCLGWIIYFVGGFRFEGLCVLMVVFGVKVFDLIGNWVFRRGVGRLVYGIFLVVEFINYMWRLRVWFGVGEEEE